MKFEIYYLFGTIFGMICSAWIAGYPNSRDRDQNIKLKLENARLRKRIEDAERVLKSGE